MGGGRGGWLVALAAAVALGLGLAGPQRDLAAQDTPPADRQVPAGPWMPPRGKFTSPAADFLEPRFGVGLLFTDVFAPGKPRIERPAFSFPSGTRLDPDVHGTAALGGTLPLWRANRPAAGVVVGMQAGVFARFRMREPSRDAVSADWLAALPIELDLRRATARLRLVHRSSHLGDELIEETRARRVNFGHEAIELLLAHRPRPPLRLYGGGGWVFRSNTAHEPFMRQLRRHDRFTLQAGSEALWYPWARGRLGLIAAADWQSAPRTGWASVFSLTAGLAARSPTRSLRLLLRFLDGPSPLHQFFLTTERFWGFELVADL